MIKIWTIDHLQQLLLCYGNENLEHEVNDRCRIRKAYKFQKSLVISLNFIYISLIIVDYILQMSNLILPPSCNWFQHNGVCSRIEDRLLVTSCFKNVVAYRVPGSKGPLETLKLISHVPGKVTGVSIFPDHSNHEFGHMVAALGDQGTISLIDMRCGSTLAQQKVENNVLSSLCWGFVRDDDVVVAVGCKGYMVIWQPKYLVSKSFILEPKKNLSVVEVLPHLRHQALVASDKTIFLVSLQNGDILNQYKGHDSPIYCIRIYPGEKNPKTIDALQKNCRWKLEEGDHTPSEIDKDDSSPGPFFASSDFGRKILVWDLNAKRFLASAVAPISCNSGSKRMGKDRPQGKNNHIALNWAQDRLYSSSVTGEVVEWNLSHAEPKYKLISHHHSRVIYNLETMGSLIMTFSQDRLMQGYDLATSSSFFTIPTMGSCAHCMAFSPHDANRLAVGMQDESIKLLTFGCDSRVKMHSLNQNIKGRVLSISWHPVHESKLLFGTSEGQVGVADIITNKTTTFAYFHQKATYKVEWGPAIAPNKTGMNEEWYAFSFGDRELLARNYTKPMEDPVWLDKFVGIEKGVNSNFCLSEFSFSPDYHFLALGSINGEIKIYNRFTLDCIILISRVRKVIQHLLWKPPSTSELSYILGVASGENSVYIFDLQKECQDSENLTEPLTVTQASRELCSHAGRVIWLSWSPHTDGLLATASYDHTVQIWNTITGEPVCNYGGHTHRVFRTEFSPIDPDKVISFAEENCIHEWHPSAQKMRIPAENAALMKENRKKNKIGFQEEEIMDEESVKNSDASGTTVSNIKSNAENSGVSSKRIAKKSSFPLFHNVCSRKKNFHHMCLLSLMEAKRAEQEGTTDEDISEDLEEELNEVTNHLLNGVKKQDQQGIENHIETALNKYSGYMPIDEPLPEVKDVSFFLNFFGTLPQIDSVVKEEIKHHHANENFSRANLMHCWKGSLESHIKWAAVHKRLDAFLVASAPQISFSLWEFACEAYAEQLIEADDPVTAATYLISIHKDEEAVNLLVKHRHYREALTIAKYRLGFNSEVIERVLSMWASSAIFEGNFEVASFLQFCLGNTENAARTLARRSEPRSLIVAAQLFLYSKSHELATSTAILAFKEASNKNEFYKFEPILAQMPNLEWCKCVNICHQSLWELIGLLKKKFLLGAFPSDGSQESSLSSGNDLLPEAESMLGPNLLSIIIQRWNCHGFIPTNYAKFSKDIKNGLSTQRSPTSLKNLWFLIAISLSEMLLDGLNEGDGETNWEHNLDLIMKHIAFWGKNDQAFYLTHILLPNGILDLSSLEGLILNFETSPVISQLRDLYILSETKMLLSLFEADENYLPWRTEQSKELHTSAAKENGENHVDEGNSQSTLNLQDDANLHQFTLIESKKEDALLSKPKVEMSSENNNIALCLVHHKDEFLSNLESYVDIVFERKSKGDDVEECVKNLRQIVSNLHTKATLSQQFFTNILNKMKNDST